MKYYITVDWLINLLVDLTDLTVCLDTQDFLRLCQEKMPHQLDKSKILPPVTTAIYMTLQVQIKRMHPPTAKASGKWPDTPQFSHPPSMVCQCCDRFWSCDYEQSAVVTVWLQSRALLPAQKACMCNELPLAEFILKQNQIKNRKHLLCYCTLMN